jgi:succinate dehydrogenase / fumarate reductase cytochrome b subunit
LTSLVYTITETLRYRGALGQWSWVLHRLTGLGVLFFLVLHVIDTSWAVFYPDLYEHAIAIYQSPLFTIGEFGLVAAVVYHALNGLRIAIFDAKPNWWKYQNRAAVYVLIGTAVILLPTFGLMFSHVLKHYSDPNVFVLPINEAILGQVPFLAGMAVAAIAALLLSALTQLIVRTRPKAVGERGNASQIERFWWSFMRLSGVLIIPLVFGHLAFMHVLQGVFDLTVAGAPVVGTFATNASGTATEFVYHRWAFAISGVFVWRLYDIALLALVVVHGFNGFRYVLTDYTGRSPILRRAAVYLCVIGSVVLLVVGGAALIRSVDPTSIELAQEALAKIRGQ